MAALSFTFLGVFALILANQLRAAFKAHQEAQQRIKDAKRLHEDTVQRGRQDPLLKKLSNKGTFEEDLISRADEPQNAVAYMSMDIQGFKVYTQTRTHARTRARARAHARCHALAQTHARAHTHTHTHAHARTP